ncbi:MAG TPA: hypothetical protein VH113_01470 [Gemmatimonadales bacterium]|jgi:hypothetical protein|nr:hypothetical protein [Gemmatimonadales bacterium]
MTRILFSIVAALALPGIAGAQAAGPKRVHLEGRWEAKVSDGLHYVMVRADSSAQFGEQVARWRVVGDSIWFTLGDGAWQVYGLKMAGDKLTLSGGDLDQPVTLRRVGPATARPAGLAVPEAPPDTARAWH